MSGRDKGLKRKAREKAVAARRKAALPKKIAERAMTNRSVKTAHRDRVPGETIVLADNAPMPPRNGPCPMHPEHKLKSCPHGCLFKFERHRGRTAGDTVIVPVAADARHPIRDKESGKVVGYIPLPGKVGKEDPVVAAVHDMLEATDGNG